MRNGRLSGLGWHGTTGVLLLACLACTGTGTSPDPAAPLIVGIPVGPNSLDPRVGTDEASQRVHQLLFGSLMRLDDELRVVPDLATGMDRPDPLSYRVFLRRGVRFHNGRVLTAADVVHTFASFLDPEFVSPRKGAYRLLESVTAEDEHTVLFKLKEPFGSFPINLVMGIVPADAGPDFGRRPVGTGPFALDRFVPDERVELSRFDGYWEGPARSARIVIRVVPDDTMRGLELRKGTIDLIVNDLAPDIVYQLEERGHVQVIRSPGSDYQYIGLNLKDPVLGDVRVRQALGYAIDREAIVRYLRRGLATPAVGIIPPASWAFAPAVFSFTYDPARARRLLDEAGYPDPDGDGPLPRLHLSLKTSTGEFVRLQGAVIQENLRDVGVALDVRSQEFATLYADVLRGNFQAFTLQWVGVSDPDMLRRAFHSSQVPPVGFNRGYFRDAEVDHLIDAATGEQDEARRLELYVQAQERVAREVPYISLWYKTNVAIAQPDLRGVRLSPSADFGFLKAVWRDTTTPSS